MRLDMDRINDSMLGTIHTVRVWCAEFYAVENGYRAEEELDVTGGSLALVPSQRWVGVPCLCNVNRESFREELRPVILLELSELDSLFCRIFGHDQCSLIDKPRMKVFDYRSGWTTFETPPNILVMAEHPFLPLEPERHLWKLIFCVCCTVSFLGEIDVKALSILCVVVVRCSVELDVEWIMVPRVKLWKIKVLTDAEVSEYS
jgi:hypothetical protein